MIHRDLKPANIFIEQRPNLPAVVKVLDFGVAKFVVEEHDDDYNTLTQVGAIIGTPRYMSPEQCSGAAPLTPASDVYSLGIILYEMLSGIVPFNAETPLGVALKQVSEPPQSLREIVSSVPGELEKFVLHALAKNPQERPQTANDFRRELYETADDLGLEHAESTNAPTLERLKSAGTESPSGRLVIDLATLRQVQAAITTNTSEHKPSKESQATAESEKRPAFDRLNVPLVKRENANRPGLAIAAAILIIAFLGSGIIAARWWRGTDQASASSLVAASPTPTATPTATPTPTPTPNKERTPGRRRTDQPSKIKKVWNKVKGIFG